MTSVLSTLLQAHERVEASKSGNDVDRSVLASAVNILATLPHEYLTVRIGETHDLLESIVEPQDNEPPLANVRETALIKLGHAENLQVLQMKEPIPRTRLWTGTNDDWDPIDTAKGSPHVRRLSPTEEYYRRDQRVVLRSMGLPTREDLIKSIQSDSATFGIFQGSNYAGHFFVESPPATPNEKVIVHAGVHAAAQERTHKMVEDLLEQEEFADVESVRIAVHLHAQWLLEGLHKNGFQPDRLMPLHADHFGMGSSGDDAVLMRWQWRGQKLKAKMRHAGPHRLMEYFPAPARQNEDAK